MDVEQTNGARPARDNLFRVISRDVEVREADDGGKPTMTGVLIRYGEWTEIDSMLEGHFMERFATGSMKKTLTERTPKVLFQHGRDAIGKQPIGKAVSFDHSDDEVRYEVELYDGVPDLIVSGLRDGAYGISFQFSILREDRVQAPERSEHNPDGITERSVREAAVAEFGPVTFPAYSGSTAAVRSCTDEVFIEDLAATPDRLERYLEARKQQDADREDREQESPADAEPDAPEGVEAHLEREQDDTIEDAPSEETPEPVSTSPQGRRAIDKGGLVLPVHKRPRHTVLPDRESEGETTWSPIRLP